MPDDIRIEGLAHLQRTFSRLDGKLQGTLRDVLKGAAEPVRSDAEQLALHSITRMTIPWSRMRVGVTRHAVYVAPAQRGVKARGNARRRRPNLKPLLRNEMETALAQNRSRVRGSVKAMLGDLANDWGRGG